MKFKRIISLALCVLILYCAFVPAASAVEKKNDYSIVLIHGLMGWGESDGLNDVVPYWGTLCGNVPEYLRRKGVEVYTASVGGQSSVWDQTCELYALLTGTRVDYGEAHAKEHGHARYGRTYKEPLYPEFGKKKVHLYGYSLGGPVARLFASLLEYGYPEELAACNNPSPLFKGGKGHYIYSVTTVAAPHDGTLVMDRNGSVLANAFVEIEYMVGGLISNSPYRTFWDLQFEQFGYTDYPDDGMEGDFSIENAKRILDSKDCAFYDLTVEGAREVNKKIKIVDDIYYFSITSESCFVGPITGKVYSDVIMNPSLLLTSPIIIGHENGEYMGEIIDDSWDINDGIVSTYKSLYPKGEPHKDYNPDDVKKGVWNVLPVINNMDHTDFMGLITNPIKVYRFYNSVCEIIYSI